MNTEALLEAKVELDRWCSLSLSEPPACVQPPPATSNATGLCAFPANAQERPPLPLCSHINALTLAHALGVDAVLIPPAWSRTPASFSRKDQTWNRSEPVSTLLDLEAMSALWAQRGMRLLEVGWAFP